MSSHFDRITFRDRISKAWWNPDRFLPISGDMSCDFEEFQLEFINGEAVGSIEVSSLPLNAFFFSYDAVSAGDLETTLQPFEFEAAATVIECVGSIDVAFVNPSLKMWPGLYVSCTFEPFEFESFYFIEGEKMDNCIFKELTFNGSASSTFSSLEGELSKFDCTMYVGTSMDCAMEKMEAECYAFVSIQANLAASLRRLELDLTGGKPPALAVEGERLTVEMSGSTPIFGNIKLQTLLNSCAMEGRTGNFASLEVALVPYFIPGWAGVTSPLGKLEGTLRPLTMNWSGVLGFSGNLDVLFGALDIEMSEGAMTNGDLDLEQKALGLEMFSGGDYFPSSPGTCDEPITLEFGVC